MIWAILVLTSLWSLSAGALAAGHERGVAAARQAIGAHKPTAVIGCILGITPWAIAACWTVYAFQVGDWRFAAIALVPKAAGLLINLARYGKAT